MTVDDYRPGEDPIAWVVREYVYRCIQTLEHAVDVALEALGPDIPFRVHVYRWEDKVTKQLRVACIWEPLPQTVADAPGTFTGPGVRDHPWGTPPPAMGT
jgi:hypothetical protein